MQALDRKDAEQEGNGRGFLIRVGGGGRAMGGGGWPGPRAQGYLAPTLALRAWRSPRSISRCKNETAQNRIARNSERRGIARARAREGHGHLSSMATRPAGQNKAGVRAPAFRVLGLMV